MIPKDSLVCVTVPINDKFTHAIGITLNTLSPDGHYHVLVETPDNKTANYLVYHLFTKRILS